MKDKKVIVIHIEHDMWKSLRKIAFNNELSMSELTRRGIETVINKYNKNMKKNNENTIDI